MLFFKPADIFDEKNLPFGLDARDYFSEAWSINPQGSMIVGTIGKVKDKTFSKEAGVFQGFTRQATFGGVVIEPFNYDNADATSAVGCNDKRDIVGFFRNSLGELHGYVALNGDTSLPPFDIRGAKTVTVPTTAADPNAGKDILVGVFGINNQRLVVGSYWDQQADRRFGFVAHGDDRARPIRNVIAIDMNQVNNDPKIVATRIDGINSQGDIVGSYKDDTNMSLSFKWKVVVNANNSLSLVGAPEPLKLNFGDVVAYDLANDLIICEGNEAGPTGNRFGFLLIPDYTSSQPSASGSYDLLDIATGLTPRRTFAHSMCSGRPAFVVGAYRKQVVLMGEPPINLRQAYVGLVDWVPEQP